ncbi:hypothetical protein [Methanoculleus chikugoensis]|uniref:hypothetical protein n=1 Tax=Methanoculleus chikugoensis TaxID=118126 RepID=UPI001FB461AB|nr:hypothetical protein [Methanoculleus chikugoensis]
MTKYITIVTVQRGKDPDSHENRAPGGGHRRREHSGGGRFSNNFDFLRFAAAAMIVFAHATPSGSATSG